jgi:rSAM/selenodomain-associated transferase 2
VQSPLASHSEVAIIIPTRNEEPILAEAIQRALLLTPQVIVVDGCSTDSSFSIAQSFPIQAIQTMASRGHQQNVGAEHSTADWLLFVHADTLLPPSSFDAWQTIVRTGVIACGAFRFGVLERGLKFRFLERYVAARCALARLPFGDQALFFSRHVFHQVGGFRSDYPFMEDIDVVLRIRNRADFAILSAPVFTSGRRYADEGFVKRGAKNLYLQWQLARGKHPQQLLHHYNK